MPAKRIRDTYKNCGVSGFERAELLRLVKSGVMLSPEMGRLLVRDGLATPGRHRWWLTESGRERLVYASAEGD